MVQIITEFTNGRKPADLLTILDGQNVDFVYDIRYSDYMPVYYRRAELGQYLAQYEIAYFDMHVLGNPPYNRPPKESNFQKAKEWYLSLLENTVKQNAISSILHKIKKFPNAVFCLLCYCPTTDPRLCHRFWLKEYLENKLNEMGNNATFKARV